MKKTALALVGALLLLLCAWKLQRDEAQFLADVNRPEVAGQKLQPPPVVPAQPAEVRAQALRKRSTAQLQSLLSSLDKGTATHGWTRAELVRALAARGADTPAN